MYQSMGSGGGFSSKLMKMFHFVQMLIRNQLPQQLSDEPGMNMHVKAWGLTVCRPAFKAADTTRCNADQSRCEWTFESESGATKAKVDYAETEEFGNLLFLTLHYSYGEEDLGYTLYAAGDAVADKTANGEIIIYHLKEPLKEIMSNARPPKFVHPRKKKKKWKKKKSGWGPKPYLDKFVASTQNTANPADPAWEKGAGLFEDATASPNQTGDKLTEAAMFLNLVPTAKAIDAS